MQRGDQRAADRARGADARAAPTPAAQTPAAQTPAAQTPATCDAIGNVQLICGQNGPEDLVVVPGAAEGGRLFHGGSGGVVLSASAIGCRASCIQDRRRRSGSTRRPEDVSGTAGRGVQGEVPDARLYLQEGRNSVHTIYVVVHGGREAVEVFELDARPQTPTLTSIGCAVATNPIGLALGARVARRRIHCHGLPAAQPADGGRSEG